MRFKISQFVPFLHILDRFCGFLIKKGTNCKSLNIESLMFLLETECRYLEDLLYYFSRLVTQHLYVLLNLCTPLKTGLWVVYSDTVLYVVETKTQRIKSRLMTGKRGGGWSLSGFGAMFPRLGRRLPS